MIFFSDLLCFGLIWFSIFRVRVLVFVLTFLVLVNLIFEFNVIIDLVIWRRRGWVGQYKRGRARTFHPTRKLRVSKSQGWRSRHLLSGGPIVVVVMCNSYFLKVFVICFSVHWLYFWLKFYISVSWLSYCFLKIMKLQELY